MTAYEIVMVVIGMLGLLISFGGFIVAFIAFHDKINKNAYPVCRQDRRCSL